MPAAGLLPLGQFLEHRQRLKHRFVPHLRPADIAETLASMHRGAVACHGGEMHEPDRLVG